MPETDLNLTATFPILKIALAEKEMVEAVKTAKLRMSARKAYRVYSTNYSFLLTTSQTEATSIN